MGEINVDVSSPEELAERLSFLAENFPQETASGLFQSLGEVLSESHDQCPWKTGYLAGSGHVTEPEITDGEISAQIGYSADYAIYVHENLEAYHPVGKAKFLEDPVNAHSTSIVQRIVDITNKLIGV